MTVMALKKKNNMKKPFKLKSGNKPSFAKLAGVSPAKAMDVLVDGEFAGTGSEARSKAARQEKINEALGKMGKTSVERKGKTLKRKLVEYTGPDALAKAKEDGADYNTIEAIKRGILGTTSQPYTKGMTYQGSPN